MHLHHRYTYILSIQNQMNVYSIRYQQYKVKKFLTWFFISILSSTSVTQYIIHHSEACDDQRCGGGQSGGGQ